jgi:hypothetical protein
MFLPFDLHVHHIWVLTTLMLFLLLLQQKIQMFSIIYVPLFYVPFLFCLNVFIIVSKLRGQLMFYFLSSSITLLESKFSRRWKCRYWPYASQRPIDSPEDGGSMFLSETLVSTC